MKLQGPLLEKFCPPDGRGWWLCCHPCFPPPALNVANFHHKGKAGRAAKIQPNGAGWLIQSQQVPAASMCQGH